MQPRYRLLMPVLRLLWLAAWFLVLLPIFIKQIPPLGESLAYTWTTAWVHFMAALSVFILLIPLSGWNRSDLVRNAVVALVTGLLISQPMKAVADIVPSKLLGILALGLFGAVYVFEKHWKT